LKLEFNFCFYFPSLGTPFIMFRTDPSVELTLINNQPLSGLFHVLCPIMDGDNCDKIAKRIFRSERNVKDAKKVTLYRHEDPILGPRKIPTLEKPLDGKIQILADQIFRIDLEKKEVFLEGPNGKTAIGENIIFRV
jgi:leucyl-tRNA synthetase